MSSPRIRRKLNLRKKQRLSTSSDGQRNVKGQSKESDLGVFSEKVSASGGFDSKINDSDIQLAGLDLSWSVDNKENEGPEVRHQNTTGKLRSSTPVLNARPTIVHQKRQSLKARIQARIEANSRTPTATTPLRAEENGGRANEFLCSLDTQQREFVERRLTEAEDNFFGLPRTVRALLNEHRGITKLYDWQEECLRLPAVEAGKNLIYSLPTSGGKTLVAEILIFKQLLCSGKDALLILPYVSIVQEKVTALTPFGLGLDFLVEEYAGSRGKLPPTKRQKRKSVFVATIEKAHSIVNSLIAEKRLDDLGLVVVDELHMIGEGGMRGAVLEMTITKLRTVSPSTRLVGMSATLSNINELSLFMNAELYTNDFRPVELKEFVKVEDSLYEIDNSRPGRLLNERLIHRRFLNHPYTKEMRRIDPDCIAGLVSEVVPRFSCLVFCPTKRQCESLAELLVKMMPREMAEIKAEERSKLLQRLLSDTEGQVCPVLARTLPLGVAYHHSGLTGDERKVVEEGYLSGALNILCSTSTLAAGVNLPAKRVILRSPYVGRRFLTPSEYRQMIGRAGRAGLDSSGESIVILKPHDRKNFASLLASSLNACESSLMCNEGHGLRVLILSVLTLELASDFHSVHRLVSHTLLARQLSPEVLMAAIRDELQGLMDAGLIEQIANIAAEQQTELPRLRATSLGKASVRGSVDPGRSSRLVEDLRIAQHSLNMTSHLHLLYLVTPYDLAETVQPDWPVFYRRLEKLSISELSLLSIIGLPEAYVARKASGQNCRKPVDDLVVSRVYLSLLLFDLWRQESLWTVAERFGLPRGFVQQLLASASSMAASLAHFVTEFPEFWCYQDILPTFARRLSHCANIELLPLMELPGVKRARARQLYDAGFRSLNHIAHAEVAQLCSQIEHLPRRAARQMVQAAKMMLAEQADTLMEEAQRVLALPDDAGTAKSGDSHDDSDLFA